MSACHILGIQSSRGTSDLISANSFASWQLAFGRCNAPRFERFLSPTQNLKPSLMYFYKVSKNCLGHSSTKEFLLLHFTRNSYFDFFRPFKVFHLIFGMKKSPRKCQPLTNQSVRKEKDEKVTIKATSHVCLGRRTSRRSLSSNSY